VARFTRQRFRDICKGERLGDFGILADVFTVLTPDVPAAWVAEGAPPVLAAQWPSLGTGIPQEVRRYFDFDDSRLLYEVHSGINSGSSRIDFRGASFQDVAFLVSPPFDLEVVEEDEQDLVFVSTMGSREKVRKGSEWGLTLPVQRPVRDRTTWERFRERLDPRSPERYPADWDAYAAEVNRLDCPVGMEVGGFFGYLNMWVGTQDLMLLFYDDPGLVDDMMEAVLQLEMQMVERVTRDIRLDFVCYWEDMAYRSGPMISPAMVRRHMLPRYQRLNEVIRSRGCEVFFLDSDGDVDLLIPLWLEAGINLFWPLECAAGMDPWELRRRYGKNIILAGGLDKRIFAGDKTSLEREVMSKVPQLVGSGPYFPSPDHAVPSDTPFQNFCFYINLLRRIRGDEPIDF